MITPITTAEELSIHVAKYRQALQTQPSAEARFLMVSEMEDEMYLLTRTHGYCWIGVQRGTVIVDAPNQLRPLEQVLDLAMRTKHMALYYSDNGVERLRWMAEHLAALQATTDPVA